jgi:ABC-type Fe3+ transport system permease subunit
MIYFGVIVGLVILAAMIYTALNKQSSFTTRVASLIALALMIISLIICLSYALMSGKVAPDESVIIIGVPLEAPKAASTNPMMLLLLVIFLLAVFVMVAVISMRGHHKKPLKNISSG